MNLVDIIQIFNMNSGNDIDDMESFYADIDIDVDIDTVIDTDIDIDTDNDNKIIGLSKREYSKISEE